jgi:hypothetical protein
MTKKLEEFFNVDTVDLHESQYDNSSPPEVNTEVVKSEIESGVDTIRAVNTAIDKIDFALPTIRDLEASDDEMDELASIAQEKFQDLMDLGMNVEPRFSGVILETASTLLGHAITAKTAKMDKKLKMVNLQLQKAKLDHQIRKDAGESEDGTIEGTGIVVDRATLLNEILAASKKTDS